GESRGRGAHPPAAEPRRVGVVSAGRRGFVCDPRGGGGRGGGRVSGRQGTAGQPVTARPTRPRGRRLISRGRTRPATRRTRPSGWPPAASHSTRPASPRTPPAPPPTCAGR